MGPRAALQTAVLFALGLSAAAMMLYRFAAFPGLHGDEAWTGLRALDHVDRGFFTLHGMRYYAGSLYPYVLSRVFEARGASVESLRLPGLVLNVAGLGIFLALLLHHSKRSAALFTALSCTSLLLLLQARLAWEVMAWNLFGQACLVAVAYVVSGPRETECPCRVAVLRGQRPGGAESLRLRLLEPRVRAGFRRALVEQPARSTASRFFLLNVLGMAVVLAACVLQWLLDDETFQRHPAAVLAVLGVLPHRHRPVGGAGASTEALYPDRAGVEPSMETGLQHEREPRPDHRGRRAGSIRGHAPHRVLERPQQ